MKSHITIVIFAAFSLSIAYAADTPQADIIKNKMETVILPDISFKNTPLRSALDKIRTLSATADTEPDETKRGVNIVLKMEPISIDAITISADFNNPKLGEVFSEIAKQTNCKVIVESFAVTLVPENQ